MATNIHVAGPARRTPWHLWVAGIVGLVWNSYGGYDYFMSKTRGDEYFVAAGMTAEQIAYFHSMPAWMTAVWAIGVWGALLGTALLLARSRFALPVFVASLVAYVLSVIYQYVISPAPGGSGGSVMVIVQIAIFAGCVFFVWYSNLAIKRGWLR